MKAYNSISSNARVALPRTSESMRIQATSYMKEATAVTKLVASRRRRIASGTSSWEQEEGSEAAGAARERLATTTATVNAATDRLTIAAARRFPADLPLRADEPRDEHTTCSANAVREIQH